MADAAMEQARWRGVAAFAKWYAWLTVGAVLFGIAVAHKVLFTGTSWTTCGESQACVLTFHLLEVPLIGYVAFVAYYALARLSRANARRLGSLIGLANVVELVFALFEILLLLDSLRRGAPVVESILLAAVATVLLSGVALGFTAQLRITDYLHPALDPRFAHPASERELIALVREARAQGRQLRVRGSEHSTSAAIYTDDGGANIEVQLDRYTRIVRWDNKERRVTVQGGCHLGVDPHDPLSDQRNSLLYQLERRGWALPDLGGITHQTVAGFLSTGSTGGTTTYDLGESVVGLRIIDGTGQVHDLAPNPADPSDEETNPFYAAGVSMGLLGVISEVTLQCVPRYDIIGGQETTATSACAIDLFGRGPKGLADWFRGTPYSRLLWWPQAGVDKMQVWHARRTQPGDESRTHVGGGFVPKPFDSVPGGNVSQALINAFFSLISHDKPPYEPATQAVVRRVLNTFLGDEAVEFWDRWHTGLPMDNQISDTFMPTEFTELFIDLERTPEVMQALRDFYAGDQAMGRTGAYACEIYPARRSRFWMSPTYGKDTLRVDVFWFETEIGHPATDFYPQYWELLRPFDYRFHWGKHLAAADSSTGADYVRRQYPKWDAFMAVRARMDPDGVFLSSYWRGHLGLDRAQPARTPLRAVG